MKKKYTGIDLFCGIGGFRLAMKSNNVKCVFSSDNDKFAQQTYEANFHEIPTGDIKAVEAKDIPHFDILTAGFPCQPFSYAGEKQGFNDEVRGTLFFDVCRILEYHKPPMVFLENVKGLKSHDKGKTRVCQNDASSFFYKQNPDFHKPGLCHVQKNLYL